MKPTRIRSTNRRRIFSLCLALSAIPLFAITPAIAQANDASVRLTAVEPVAVIELTPKGDASANEAGAVTDRVRGLVVQSGLYQVMEREAMTKIMREQGFQTTQDCSGEACVQIGRLLSVKRMITGSLMRMGNSYTVNLRLIDTESGAILREEFLDCACAIDGLTRDKLPWLVAQLLGSPAPRASLTPPDPAADTRPIRVRRPWLAQAQTGLYHRFVVDAQFSINEYFAVHGGGGYGFPQPFGYLSAPGIPNTWQPMAFGGVKAYFNPHDIAGFADLTFSTTNWLHAVLGAEYRHPVGFTISAAGGLGYSVPYTTALWTMNAGVGISF